MSRDFAESQRAFAEALRSGEALAEVAERLVAESARLSPSKQLEIYREQYLLRHLDVLREDFGSIESLLGGVAFETLGKAYLQAFPPCSFTLRDLGRDLERFVSAEKPWSDDALVADLARVEWAFVEAFDAADSPSLALEDIANVAEDAWPSMRVVLKSSVQRVALAHPAHEYRLAVRRSGEPAVRPAPSPAWVLVFRGPEHLQCLDVERDAFALLGELANGVPLGEACERVAAQVGESDASFEAKIGAWFSEWTALGLVSAIA